MLRTAYKYCHRSAISCSSQPAINSQCSYDKINPLIHCYRTQVGNCGGKRATDNNPAGYILPYLTAANGWNTSIT